MLRCLSVRNNVLRTCFTKSFGPFTMGAIGSKRREYRIESTDATISAASEDYVEKVVCKEGELKNGEMREFDLGQGKVLVIKQNGSYSAIGSKCTHYGAPLSKGVYKDGTIRCPWHGACFNATTGDIEDFPGLDSLPCFQVSVENDQVKVRAPTSALKSQKRTKTMVAHVPSNPKTIVIVGGGAAGQSCVETLRQNGFDGKLILITKEKHYPYDRPKLSKALDAKGEDLYLRKPEFFRQANITVMVETEVTGIDTDQHWVQCDNGKLMVKYNSVMLATGGIPVKLSIAGSHLQNICYLRTPEDGNYIAQNAAGKAVVIVGSSFIGMEVASYLLTKARSINVISRNDVPFKYIFGEIIGKRIKKMFEERGVVFHSNNSITKFLGNDDCLTGMELESGDVLQADICIVGIGVIPSTAYLKSSNIKLNSKGLICVNEYMETSIPKVFACGDIVEFPLSVFKNQRANICHFQMASAHGRAAAFNMLGKKQELISVPFFWSVMCGKSFRFAGYGAGFDDIIIDGNVEDLKFVAYFCKKEEVVGVCTLNRDPAAASYASDLRSGIVLAKSQIITG